MNYEKPPFDYELQITSFPGFLPRTMICCHGYGDNYQIASCLKEMFHLEATVVGFNFPEHDLNNGREYDPRKASFGTIDELLPLLFVLKKVVVEQGVEVVDLYGFSAGGGAVVNVLALLCTERWDVDLKQIGIDGVSKKKILRAIERGMVLLDVPLKSVEEIIAARGSSEELEILAQKYRDNDFRPMDSLRFLKGAPFNLLLYFDQNDEVLSNRDDLMYITALQESLQNVRVIVGNEGGHMAPHMSLWKAYADKIRPKS